ncbi:MAG TPA: hypothetical protein VGC84_15230 [Ilumatobacteraceae bacterium]
MATAKKAPATKTPAKKASPPAKSTVTKNAAAAVATRKPAPPKKAVPPPKPAKKSAPAAKKSAPAAKKSPPVTKAAPAKKAATPPVKSATKSPAPKPRAAAPQPKNGALMKKAAPATATKQPAAPAPPPAPTPAKKAAAKKSNAGPVVFEIPAVKGVTKDGVAYTKDFDVKFLIAQRTLLLEEKAALTGQATRLEDEANSLIEEQEMGDVQFDDEGGEGDTMVVERERDLTLSAQARQTIADIEAALTRLTNGRYGYSTESGRPIPRERLEAIPWATMLVEEKVGGIGRR